MQRHPFEAYLDKVFDWRRLTAALTEGRQYPLYPWAEAFDAVFWGSACQFGPLHRMETECCRGALHKRIGSLSEDMLGYAMQRQNPAEIFDLGCQVAQQLKRNGVLQSDWARWRCGWCARGWTQATCIAWSSSPSRPESSFRLDTSRSTARK